MKTVAGNLAAFRAIVRKAARSSLIVESFGGIGGQTQVLREELGNIHHEAWDKDRDCYAALDKIEGLTTFFGEFPLQRLPRDTLLILDFNAFTLKHFDKYSIYFKLNAKQIIFTDIARGKLHLHPKAYGLSTASWDDYVAALGERLTPYKFIFQEKAPRSITYFLVSL